MAWVCGDGSTGGGMVRAGPIGGMLTRGLSCAGGGAFRTDGTVDRIEVAETGSDDDPAGLGAKADVLAVGDAECDDGVGRLLGDVTADEGCMSGGKLVTPGSILGVMAELDRRGWCLFISVRGMGDGCTMFWAT